jgi:hypothetical protein
MNGLGFRFGNAFSQNRRNRNAHNAHNKRIIEYHTKNRPNPVRTHLNGFVWLATMGLRDFELSPLWVLLTVFYVFPV